MARSPNKLETVEVKLSTTPPVVAYLDRLVETGLYGKNRSEAAERLVTRGLEALMKDGTLANKPKWNYPTLEKLEQSKEGLHLAGPLYPNQPLVEVATEVRFEGDLNVEAVRPKFQDMIRGEYPRLLVSGAQEGVAPSLQPIRFEDADSRSGIQLAINSFSYFSREYPGHETFFGQVSDKLQIIVGLLGMLRVTRVGWRYINALPFTRENELLPLSRFFQDSFVFGNALKDGFEDLSCHLSLPIEGKRLNVKLQSAQSTGEPGAEILLLDIDAFNLYSPAVKMDASAVMTEIQATHDLAYKTFESLISDNYRAFLRGESDAM